MGAAKRKSSQAVPSNQAVFFVCAKPRSTQMLHCKLHNALINSY